MKDEKKEFKDNTEKKEEFVEINLGKFFNIFNIDKIRKNPWIIVSIVLALVVILILIFNRGSIAGVSGEEAGMKLVDYINSNTENDLTYISSMRDGEMYTVIVEFQGQQIPVFVSLDGKYAFLADSAISLNGNIADNSINGNTNTQKVSSVNIGDSPVVGSANAPVIILEFSDFECPFCKKFFTDSYPDIESNYIKTGKVKLVFKQFPLISIHPTAQAAAEASLCAQDLGGDEVFWKFHDKIFLNQAQLSNDNLKKWASELGIDISSCLDSGKMSSKVLQDESYGQSLGVSGTPAFLIGNEEKGYVFVSGAQPASVFEQIIEGYLAG